MMAVKHPIIALLPFWLFIFLFKFGAGLHYSLLSVLGAEILPIWVVGLVIGGEAFMQLICDVPAGFLLDRFGYARVMRIATFVFFVGALVLLFGLSLTTYVTTIIFSFVGWLFWAPGSNAYALSSAGNDQGGRYMGLLHTFGSLGIVCASLVVMFVIHASAPTIGLIIAGILLAAFIAVMKTRPDRASVHESRHKWQSYHIRREALHKVVAAVKRLNPASTMLALQNLAGAMFYGIIWFTVPLVIAQESDAGMLGIGLGVFDLAVVLLGAFLGRLADRAHKKTLIFAGLLTFAVAGIFLGFNFNILFLLLGFIATAGDEMSSVSLWSWLERLDKKHSEDGLVTGVITLFEDLGWTLGPILAGFLFMEVGPSLTIAIGAIPILVTWLFAIIFLSRTPSPPRTENDGSLDWPLRPRHKH